MRSYQRCIVHLDTTSEHNGIFLSELVRVAFVIRPYANNLKCDPDTESVEL